VTLESCPIGPWQSRGPWRLFRRPARCAPTIAIAEVPVVRIVSPEPGPRDAPSPWPRNQPECARPVVEGRYQARPAHRAARRDADASAALPAPHADMMKKIMS
jgi:hypothetical protein